MIKPINETHFYRVDDPDNTLDFGDEIDGHFSRVSFNVAMFSPLIGHRVPDEDDAPVPAS